jgi:hypothetical protein
VSLPAPPASIVGVPTSFFERASAGFNMSIPIVSGVSCAVRRGRTFKRRQRALE